MAAAAGFWNHHATPVTTLSGTTAGLTKSVGVPTTGVSATATSGTTGTGGTTGSSDDSATISANDFLTLLVTEMQNQDPTATQDPNEYINQLVQVNSLEQLIDINQTLTTSLGSTAGGTGGGTGSATSATMQPSGAPPGVAGLTAQNTLSQIQGVARAKASALSGIPQTGPGGAGSDPAATFAARLRHAPGNIAVPQANAASTHVAHALDGRSRKQSITARLPGVK